MDARIAGWVGLGSAGGGIARYVVSELLTKGAFPLGTLVVNVAGSFLLGLLLASEPRRIQPAGTAALGVGFLGGFTTMSAFSFETVALGNEGQLGLAAI
jgi:CrcB protein